MVWISPAKEISGNDGTDAWRHTASYANLYDMFGPETVFGQGTTDTEFDVDLSLEMPFFFYKGMDRFLIVSFLIFYPGGATDDATPSADLTSVTFDGVSGTKITNEFYISGSQKYFAMYVYYWKDASLPVYGDQAYTLHFETDWQTNSTDPYYYVMPQLVTGVDQTTPYSNLTNFNRVDDGYAAWNFKTASTSYDRVRYHVDAMAKDVSSLTTDTATVTATGKLVHPSETQNVAEWDDGWGDPNGTMDWEGKAIESMQFQACQVHDVDQAGALGATLATFDQDNSGRHHAQIAFDLHPSTIFVKWEGSGQLLLEQTSPTTWSSSFNYTLQKAAGNNRLVVLVHQHAMLTEEAPDVTLTSANQFDSVTYTGGARESGSVANVNGSGTYVGMVWWLDADLPSTTGTYTVGVGSTVANTDDTKNTTWCTVYEFSGVDQTNPFGTNEEIDISSSTIGTVHYPENNIGLYGKSNSMSARGPGFMFVSDGFGFGAGADPHTEEPIKYGKFGETQSCVGSDSSRWPRIQDVLEAWGGDRAKMWIVNSPSANREPGGKLTLLCNLGGSASTAAAPGIEVTGSGSYATGLHFHVHRANEPTYPQAKGPLGHPLHGALAGPVGP